MSPIKFELTACHCKENIVTLFCLVSNGVNSKHIKYNLNSPLFKNLDTKEAPQHYFAFAI